MPIPLADLDFEDRLAKFDHPRKGPGFYFLCQRDGHKNGKRKHTRFLPGKKTDAREWVNTHDVEHHNTIYVNEGMLRNVLIDAICTDYLKHKEKLEIDGLQNSQTTRHYHYVIAQYLKPGFARLGVKTVRELIPARISEFVRWARENRESEGAAIVKAISALKTIMRWAGFGSLADDIKIPRDEIRPKRFEKKDLDSATIRRLVSAMPSGSLEEAMAYLKRGTGARDMEIYRATAPEFEFDVPIETDDAGTVLVAIWEPILCAKGASALKERRHVYVLTQDVAAKVRPWVESALPGKPVFRDDECRDVRSERMREKMRARIRAASKRAGIVTMKSNKRPTVAGGTTAYDCEIGAIDSLAPIRHEVVTVVKENISLEAASAQAGHVDTSTTRKWYVKDRRTKNILLDRYKAAEILHRELPLGA
jgi:hypothetical protein